MTRELVYTLFGLSDCTHRPNYNIFLNHGIYTDREKEGRDWQQVFIESI